MHCDGCNTENARFLRIKFVPIKVDDSGRTVESSKVEYCDLCQNVVPQYARDALGQKVSLPTGFHKPFSYATGTPITSSRQYAEVLKRLNLAQKNGGEIQGK